MRECVPPAKSGTDRTALPLTTVAVPMVTPPSVKATVPVGAAVPVAPPPTVAVSVTGWP